VHQCAKNTSNDVLDHTCIRGIGHHQLLLWRNECFCGQNLKNAIDFKEFRIKTPLRRISRVQCKQLPNAPSLLKYPEYSRATLLAQNMLT